MLFYILSHLGSICQADSICQGLACHSISCHSLAVSAKQIVSAKAWHAILYLVTPGQYLPRLGMLFYILSHLGSICQGLACYSISCHALAVSAEAWHAMSHLGSICRGLACYSISCHALAVSAEGQTSKIPSGRTYKCSSLKLTLNLKNNPRLQKPKLQKPEL